VFPSDDELAALDDEIEADKVNKKWFDFSVEFCGGTHLARTSEAQHFTIVSEEAIRTGERRIIGVTGAHARKAREDAKTLESHLQTLLSSKESPEQLNVAYLKYMDDFHQAIIPAVKRVELRKKINQVEEILRVAAKKKISEQKNAGSSLSTNVTEKLKGGDGKLVVEFVANSNNKVLSDTAAEIVAACKKELSRDVAVLLFTVDPKKKQLILLSNVPDSFHNKLKGNDWVSGVASKFGGKGGGKPSVAQGTASLGAREDNAALHDEVKAEAQSQALSKLQ